MEHDKALPVTLILEIVASLLVSAIAVVEVVVFMRALHSGTRYAGSGSDLIVAFSLIYVWVMPVVILSVWLTYAAIRKNLKFDLIMINPTLSLFISILPVLFVYVNYFVFDPSA